MPSSDFSAKPVPSGASPQSRPSAPPFATQPGLRMRSVSSEPSPLRVRVARAWLRASVRRHRLPARRRTQQPSARAHPEGETPQPSTAVGTSSPAGCDPRPPPHAARCWSGCARAVAGRLPASRVADSEEAACFPTVVMDRARRAALLLAALEVVLGRGACASRVRTAAICAGSARWEAQAIAISASPRSGRARTSGSACIGFALERRKQTSPDAGRRDAAPSRTAAAWTRWRASRRRRGHGYPECVQARRLGVWPREGSGVTRTS